MRMERDSGRLEGRTLTLSSERPGTHGQSQALAAVVMARVMASRITVGGIG